MHVHDGPPASWRRFGASEAELVNADGVRVLSSMAKHHGPGDVRVPLGASRLVEILSEENDLYCMVGTPASFVAPVLSSMSRHVSHSEHQIDALKYLLGLHMNEFGGYMKAFVDAGGIRVVTTVMQTHDHDEEIANLGLGIFSTLLADGSRSVTDAIGGSKRVLDVTLSAMVRYEGNVCLYMGALAVVGECKVAIIERAIPSVIAAVLYQMRQYPEDASLQMFACHALYYLLNAKDVFLHDFVFLGGISVVVSAMNRFPDTLYTQLSAIGVVVSTFRLKSFALECIAFIVFAVAWLLGFVCSEPDAANMLVNRLFRRDGLITQIKTSGFIPALINAMRRHMETSGVGTLFLTTLLAFVDTKSLNEEILKAGGIALLGTILQNSREVSLAQQSRKVLQKLAKDTNASISEAAMAALRGDVSN